MFGKMNRMRTQWMRWLALATLVPLWGQAPSKMVLLIIGPPGSGKTTQAAKLKSKYKIPSISMADILKKEGGAKSDLSRRLKVNLAGDLVSDEVANQLIDKRLQRKDVAQGFILDGYPVTEKQATYLDAMLAQRGLPTPVVIHLSAPDNVVVERMSQRGRSDDTPEAMKRRLEEYHLQSKAVLQRYGAGQLKTIDATKTPDEVWRAIQQALGESGSK